MLARLSRPLLIALVCAAALPATAAATTVRAASGPFVVTMVAGTHSPKANAPWPIRLTATLSGRPAHCGINYQFLFQGQQVSSQIPRYPNHKPHTSFTGHFSDTLSFPANSVGYPLTLQVHVWSGSRVVNLHYALTAAK